MKVILSTFGPLHLIKSAEYLSKYVDVKGYSRLDSCVVE